MRDTVTHRGPDGDGLWDGASATSALNAGLGHRRLRIIDLSEAAAQPMVSDDGQVALTYNGEIYNFRELRRELQSHGTRFRSTGDTEVVLRAYERWGRDAVRRFDGMFALALWDGRRGELLLARDRTGKKPLFYWSDGGRLAFGSEIKAVLACPWVERALDESRLAEFLTFGYVPNPRTLYRGVLQVPPASTMTFTVGGLSAPERYWDPLAARQVGHRGALDEDIRTLLAEAVERRLVSDVPLGALLSGGIDSSLVVALMARASRDPVHTFSIGFGDDASFDERRYARLVADQFGTRHFEFDVRLDAVTLLDRLLWHHDQPFMDSSAIPTFVVSQLAAEHVTVVLNGDGGDEVFGGYDRFRAAALALRVPHPLAAAARSATARLPADHSYYSTRRRVQRYLELADRPVEERYQSWISVADGPLLGDLLQPTILTAAARPVLASMEESYRRAAGLPTLDRILYANFMTYLPDDLAVKMDRMAMANSLETRSPFLDTALIERLASVAARQKVGLRRVKPLLRRACWELIPAEIWNRPKHGFGAPVGAWFRGRLGEMFEDEVLDAGARVGDVLRPPTLDRLYREHRTGAAEHGFRLWTILTLEHWMRSLERPLQLEPPDARALGTG